MSFLTSAVVLAWVTIAALAFAMSGLLRQIRILTAVVAPSGPRLGPALGSVAPPLTPGRDGEQARDMSLLVFVDDGCQSCNAVLERMAVIDGQLPSIGRRVAIFEGNATGFNKPGIETVWSAKKAFQAFRIPVTPYAVAVSAEGRIVAADAVGSAAAFDGFLEKLSQGESR